MSGQSATPAAARNSLISSRRVRVSRVQSPVQSVQSEKFATRPGSAPLLYRSSLMTLFAGSAPGHRKASRRCLQSAGQLPGSLLLRYDLLGTCVHGRLQHAYLVTTTYKRLSAFGRQGPEVHTENSWQIRPQWAFFAASFSRTKL